jgi:hydrogenase nickel incorporation protein HypA/HybF
VVKEALLSAFELAREGTALDRAELVIEDAPLVGWCARCAAPRALPAAWELCCPTCGEPTTEIVSGRELEVVALEIES